MKKKVERFQLGSDERIGEITHKINKNIESVVVFITKRGSPVTYK